MLVACLFFLILYVGWFIWDGLANITHNETIEYIGVTWAVVTMLAGTIGVFFAVLTKGSGSMEDILFKDTAILMKTIPVSSWTLIGGKLLIGLFEFLLYSFLFILFVLVVCLLNHAKIWADLVALEIYILDYIPEILTLLSGIIIGFLVLQCAINFILILFKMFAQNHRFRKILLGLVLSILFIISSYFVGYVMGTYFKIVDFDFQENFLLLWIPLGIYTIFGILFYVISCILYEKKVNI